jgi:F-type H+-transporting ATPase subunit delta
MYEHLDRRYALALYEVAEEEGRVEEFLEDLKALISLIKNNKEFTEVLKHPQIPTERKIIIIKNIFDDKIHPKLLNFIIILLKKDRILFLEEKYREMVKIYLERHSTIVAYVKTAIKLNDAERDTLINKLEEKYDKIVLLKEEVDESLIGGVFLRIGNDVIDSSIKTRFAEIRQLVANLY